MANLFELFKYSKMLEIGDGDLRLMDVYVNIIPTSILCSLQKSLIGAVGLEKAYKEIYESAKEGAQIYNERFIKLKNFKNKHKTLDWQSKIISFAGWGVIEIAKVDFAKNSLVAHFKNPPFPKTYKELYGKSKYPVCFIPAGYNAGGLSMMAGKKLGVLETKCVAMGHPYCEFEAGSIDVIEKKRKKLWKKWGVL